MSFTSFFSRTAAIGAALALTLVLSLATPSQAQPLASDSPALTQHWHGGGHGGSRGGRGCGW